MNISREIYDLLEGCSGWLVVWIAVFTVVTSIRILRQRQLGVERTGGNPVLVEMAALPITLLQSVGFFRALGAGDVLSSLLFFWWGPGFFATVLYLVWCKSRHQKPNWHPTKHIISWACKLNYFAFMIVFFLLDKPGLMLAYSVWVINDQYGLAFLSMDADRLRRTFHDRWIIRILYPLGLFVPWFYPETPIRWFAAFYAMGLLALWLAGLGYVARRRGIMTFSDDPSLLRNMVYFAKPQPSQHPATRPPA